ncbi:MAG: hypothetical protein ACI9R3_004736 [Verrucomicrobiales bacterium]|jgi:hypothetical protein
MKTTLELPDDLFRLAKIAAARQGRPLKDIFAEALREKLMRSESDATASEPPWMQYFGAFGGSAENQAETHRIQEVVDAEFGTVDPLEVEERPQ